MRNKKELKKLSRRELVDIIFQMKKNEQQLQDELAALREEAQDRRIRLSQAGSIAEAATSIAEVFTAAQKAADLYLNEIACMKMEMEQAYEQMLRDAQGEEAQPDKANPFTERRRRSHRNGEQQAD